MLEVSEDVEHNFQPELFIVIANKITSTAYFPDGVVGVVNFTTAYSVRIDEWDELGRTYPFIYPVYRERPEKKS